MSNKLLIIITLILSSLVWGHFYLEKDKKYRQVLSNYEGLQTENQNFVSELGRSSSQSRVLQVEVEDLKEINGSLSDSLTYYQKALLNVKKTAKDLGIKLSRINSATVVGSEAKVEVKVPVYVRDSITKFTWSDNYVDLDAEVIGDSASCRVVSRDTLIQVIERVPKKFLFFRFGTKYIRQTIQSTNPHTKLTYSSTLTFKRD